MVAQDITGGVEGSRALEHRNAFDVGPDFRARGGARDELEIGE